MPVAFCRLCPALVGRFIPIRWLLLGLLVLLPVGSVEANGETSYTGYDQDRKLPIVTLGQLVTTSLDSPPIGKRRVHIWRPEGFDAFISYDVFLCTAHKCCSTLERHGMLMFGRLTRSLPNYCGKNVSGQLQWSLLIMAMSLEWRSIFLRLP